MINFMRKKAVTRSALLPAAALLIGLAGGTALAATAAHEEIVLKDPSGNIITSVDSGANAYSAKTTCFGTVGCHGDATASGTLAIGYDQMERHSYHAMNGSNEFRGFNAWNPDSVLPDGKDDVLRRSVSTQGKNWVQSPGHVGNW